MFILSCFLTCFPLLLISLSECVTDPSSDSNVISLTASSFDTVISEHEHVLVEFYAPWCGHCKQLEPEYEKAAEKVRNEGLAVVFAKVDATVEESLASEFGVQGFPTLKLFSKGSRAKYTEFEPKERNADGILAEVQKLTDPNYKPPPSDVTVLTTETFNDFVNEHNLSLVEFYAPWCGHCKALEPEFDKAATVLKKKSIYLAKVDATEEPDLATEYQIQGYPTLYVFRNGQRYDFSPRNRDSAAIIRAMIKESKPSSVEVTSIADLKLAIDSAEVTVLGMFRGSGEDSELVKLFLDATYSFRDEIKFFHSFDGTVAKAMGVKMVPSISVIFPKKFESKFEPKRRQLTDAQSVDALKHFIDAQRFPLVGEYVPNSKYDKKRPLLVVYYNVNFGPEFYEETQFWRNKIVAVASEYKDTITFAVGNEEKCAQDLVDSGLSESGNGINAVIWDKFGRKYPLEHDDDFSEELLKSFVKNYLKGSLKPVIKSEKAPKKQSGAVMTVVGDTFESLVEKNSKDVMVFLYNSEKCDACIKYLQIFAQFAGDWIKEDPDIVFAKIDVAKNDHLHQYEVKKQSLPHIYFRKSGLWKEPVPFDYEPLPNWLHEFTAEKRGKALKKSVRDVKTEL